MMIDDRLVFADIEMACLDKHASIIQIAAIAVNGNLAVVDDFEQKVRFDIGSASKEALTVNTFEPTVWKRLARQPEDAAQRFAAFLRRNASVDIVSKSGRTYQVARLVVHNAAFDGPHLIRWYKDLGIFLPAARSVYCTLQRAYWLFQEDQSLTPPHDYKLATLCEYFGIRLRSSEAHDAMADVKATLALYRAMHELTLSSCEAA